MLSLHYQITGRHIVQQRKLRDSTSKKRGTIDYYNRTQTRA